MTIPLALLDPAADDEAIDGFLAALGAAPSMRYSEDQPRDPDGKFGSGGGGAAGPTGPLDVPNDEITYPGGYNPNDVAAGPMDANDKLYWVAASRGRLQAIRDNALVPGTIGNKMLQGMILDQPPTSDPIYRGIRTTQGADNPAFDPATYQVGATVDLPLSSFSTDKGEALLYARGDDGRLGESSNDAFHSTGKPGEFSVLLEVRPGAAGLDIGPTFKGNPGHEVVSAGRYRVVSAGGTKESVTSFDRTYSGGIYHVVVEPVAVIDPQSGVAWDATEWQSLAS